MASRSTLQSIFNHVVLPPDLPGGADTQGELVEKELIRRLLEAAIFLKNNSGDDLFPTWQVIENTLKSSSLANEGGMCNKSAIVKALKRLSPENCIILRIREQNAGLLIRTSRDDDASKVIIESFEISPTAESTLSAQSALQWGFPGAVATVPFDVFNSSGFRGSLATFLEKASTEYLDQFAVKVRKAGAEVSEERNTVHPAIITQFLMTLLEVNGERLYLPVLRKRIRDDVCWDKAKLPWRRSPFWLVLRVCVQRLLYLHLGDEIGRIQYKALICLFLATLLSDCVTNLSSDRSELLRVKLCRRLAKLETEKKSLRGPKNTTHQHTEVLKVVEDSCTKSIDAAATALENEWKNWKKNFQRRVPKLPSHASPSDFRLTLPNSNEYFREILEPRRQRHPLARDIDPRLLSGIASKNTSKQFAALSKTYSSLAIREAAIESNPAEVPRAQEEIESNCIDLASSITNYMSAVGDAYDNDPEQMSLFILNIFDLWVAMDKCATAAYSLLNDYHPWFTPEILDVLLLIRWKQLKRLQAIQLHLHSRCEQAKRDKMTIFAGPSLGCFAERYVSSPDGKILAKSQARIEDSSSMLRESKSSELTDLNETFNDLTGKLRAVPCTQLRNLDGSHDIRGCKHCFYVHEDSLPMESHHDVQRRSIVFELNPPKAFAAYREATWSIVNRLCPKIGYSTIAKPEVLLSEYSQLRKYNHNQRDACFSLSSSTKSFLGTHYNWKRLPASAHNVILPHGLKWSYYDSKRKVWSGEYLEKLSFAHHFLYSSPAFAADTSTSDCSSNLTVHERWLSILAELGSSNINLSLQETTILFHHLALQAGPRLENDSMRAVHATFRDLGFCNRLAEQIGRHLDAIATNWRETNYMETLLTLSIRLFSLGHLDSRPESTKLILRIRNVTTEWIKLLRNEARNAQDVSLSETTARYCFLSAILCRRTFSPFITSRSGFDSESLKCFFEASLAMQESLVVDLSKFTRITRNMLVRDIKMAVLLTSLIREGAVKYPGSIGQAIDAVWPEGDNTQRHYADWALLPSPYNDWATSTTHGSEDTRSQVLFFHLLEGHLVIDGQTIGKLPADIRDSDILKELFGNQRLFALPSNLHHHVHLGYRNNRLIIQARVSGSTLELVPRGVFGTGQSFDLPISLITDFRQKPRIWKRRSAQRRESKLIDPFSDLAQTISRIFLHFEHPCGLTVFQPLKGKLSVEMKRLDLDFFVTNAGLLQCRQLCAVVDRDQDAGTFYGLQSMLVLRDVDDKSQRSIITPVGQISAGSYAKYTINDLLRRLECPAEPRLLYAKAQLHAFTSYLLPDPLTGRTGTEEALACLESGYCQPWMPLSPDLVAILMQISNLTPRREYYPKDKQCQQTVHWDPQLTTHIQHDNFRIVVNEILKKSDRLSQFTTTQSTQLLPKMDGSILSLYERARWRRSRYEGRNTSRQEIAQPKDSPYLSRDGWLMLLRDQPSTIHTTRELLNMLDTFDLYDIEEHPMNLCREAKEEDAYNLMFQLGLIAFRENAHMTIIRVIVSFFLLQELKTLSLPRHQSFVGFRKNERPTIDALLPIIRMSYQTPKPMSPKKKGKGKNSHKNIRPGDYLEFEKEGLELAEMLVKQWPCAQPSIEGFEATSLNLIEVCSAVLPEWQRIYWNLEFHHHINEVQAILNSHYRASNDVPVPLAPPNPAHRNTMGSHRRGHFSCPRLREDLLGKPAQYPAKPNAPIVNNAGLWQPSEPLPPNNPPAEHHSPPEILELERIVQEFGQSVCSVRSSYAEDLSQSITALKTLTKTLGVHDGHECTNIKDRGTLDEEITIAQTEIKDCFRLIVNSLSAHDARYIWLRKGNLWPRLTPVTILQQLRSSSPQKFGTGMRKLFISYARAIIRIRQDQVTVALEMMFPNSGSNSVLQMNMGQGKTSVIMPMVAAVLANGEMLNRLLIPKALLSQAAQILQARLGGLLGREIIHIPFSRRTHTSISLIEEYREIHENALRESGIILGVPEHMLSYKLSGLQRLADSKMREAEYMIRCQKWLDEVCRDVLDECDFTLAVKTQLIYPGGAQLAVDGHPNRWEVAMTVLGLVAHHLKDLARDYPQSIDILERNSTGFPVTHILRKDVEEALTSRIVDDICKRRTSILPLAECTDRAREAIRLFISQEKVDKSVVKRIASLFPDSPKARKNVYLLRGLLVHGILILCLKKRWNVQYGLHHGRDPMAVPFHAKGVPSDQAEWGHPDVAIIFTCLAFYYEGLSQQQLKRSLEAVLKSDHPATEYDRWTQSSGTLPEPLRHWNAITVDDEALVGEIWRHLRFTTVAINHFLSHFVFPLHAKQFATKLQASGWDVPLYSSSSSSYNAPITESFMRPGVTTGFSGTNDNRRLLPLNIEQRDLPGLSHTNAEVLTYLLQPRNRKYRLAADAKRRRLSEIELLKRLQLGSIRILIDAGAFIMEMDNFTVARTWLTEDWSAKGAVYFNEDNKPWVVYRNGKRVPLFASPFADDMRDCVVYLDEAHTRGTDLKLPPNAEGALTLGLRQTKDHTVQAAMRLRQLGTTQSVTFIAPPEVHQSILDVCKKTSNDAVDSSGVITWLLDQTCETNRELQPLYFAQGKDFCQRTQAAATFQGFLSNPAHRESYLDILQQPEQQTLEQLYEPRYREANPSPTEANGVVPWERVAILTKTLAQQRQESQVHESTLSSALEEVEQEREVAFEVEEEREIQRPRRPKALKFPGLHQSILAFAQRGLLAFKNIAKASDTLENTQLGTKYAIKGRSLVPHLYLSVEFTRTIKLKKLGETDDTYTRPVNWILFNTATETALVIIPEEAESLIPIMREKPAPNTHLIMYAAPWTKVMLHFNSLDYYALPNRDEGDEYSGPSAVAKSHLGFLREWLAIRRQGQNITDTPMGYVCHDLQLRSDHPFFTTRVVKAPGPNGSRLESLRFNAAAEEEYYTSDDGMDMAMRDSESDKTKGAHTAHSRRVGIEIIE
ncbi:uncharacterized protein BJX67DRAFT_387489 [Aspergillus lucknowensis]|uniref:ubiquitinyl hydrolase 1 n=1 Tax=Aspergillus lucknowensis TaxID=176173 RepID=A0ABR4LXI5_9EURO